MHKTPSIWDIQSDSNDFKIVLGLDFGTCNSCSAIWSKKRKRPKVIPNYSDNKLTPSIITFSEKFEPTIGLDTSKRNSHSINHLQGLKSLLYSSTSSIVTCTNINGESKNIQLTQLISYIIDHIIKYSIQYIKKHRIQLGYNDTNLSEDRPYIDSIVMGIPVTFTTQHVTILKETCALIGYTQVHFISESTAAALSYGLLVAGTKTVAIFDMGGGTTDVTVMLIDEGSSQVLVTTGNSNCGGQNIDILLTQYIIMLLLQDLLDINGMNGDNNVGNVTIEINEIIWNKISIQMLVSYIQFCDMPLYHYLLSQSKNMKENLTENETVTIDITSTRIVKLIQYIKTYFAQHNYKCMILSQKETLYVEKGYQKVLLRHQFERCCQPIIQQAVQVLHDAITKYRKYLISQGHSNTPLSDVLLDEVVLTGGSSRIPFLQHSLLDLLQYEKIVPFLSKTDGGEERTLCTSIDPDTAVVQGLSIYGALLMGEDSNILKDVLMLDILPTSIGVMSWYTTDNSTTTTTTTTTTVTSASAQDNIKIKDGSSNSSKSSRYFEPILYQGDRIPATGMKLFHLESPIQKYVSLDIYEEIPIHKHNTNTTSSSNNNNSTSSISGGDGTDINYKKQEKSNFIYQVSKSNDENNRGYNQSDIHTDTHTSDLSPTCSSSIYKYQLMGTYDVPVPPLPLRYMTVYTNGTHVLQPQQTLNKIQVHFTLDIHGVLSFHVTRILPDSNLYMHDHIYEKEDNLSTGNEGSSYMNENDPSDIMEIQNPSSSSTGTSSSSIGLRHRKQTSIGTTNSLYQNSTYLNNIDNDINNEESVDDSSSSMIYYLIGWCIFMIVLYIVIKVYFQV